MECFLQSAQEGRQYMMCGYTTQSVERITHHKFSRHSGSKLVAHERHHHIFRDFRNVDIALRKMYSSQSFSQSINQATCGHYLLHHNLSGLHQVQCTSERHLFRITGRWESMVNKENHREVGEYGEQRESQGGGRVW